MFYEFAEDYKIFTIMDTRHYLHDWYNEFVLSMYKRAVPVGGFYAKDVYDFWYQKMNLED